MALSQRRPTAVIHHSDQGTQYTSIAFGQRCKVANVRPSMGSVGDCFDNAMCESFFATLECELLSRRKFPTRAEAELAVFEYIEGWYNSHRRHSALDYLSPAEFERQTEAVENAPSSPRPHHPGRWSAGMWKAASPRPAPVTLPQPLENAPRFPQPPGPYGGEREERQ